MLNLNYYLSPQNPQEPGKLRPFAKSIFRNDRVRNPRILGVRKEWINIRD
jgi:hypothetical protein